VTAIRLWGVLALALIATVATPAQAHTTAAPRVVAIRLNSDIDPVSASFVKDSISHAEGEHAAALVIVLDTPGGLSTSMQDIYEAELSAKLPVIVYVAPQGGRAASAGVYVTMASDWAAMAPNTNIGAATPIDQSGGNIGSDLKRKIENDAVAKIRTLAKTHDRNANAAALTVIKATSYTAEQAVKIGLVEQIAPNLRSLLNSIDGKETKGTKHLVFHTAGADIEYRQMPWTLRLLDILINPNLLFILFLGGIAGLGYEIFHPGVILPGALGAVSLILALFGFSIVPINWAGIVLIVLGVALLLMEGWVTSHGVLGVAGVIALAAGGLLLFRAPGEVGVDPLVVLTVSALIGAGLAFVVTKVVAARHQPVTTTGIGTLLGQQGVVRTPLRPRGEIYVEGALWQAETDAGTADVGDTVVVRGVDGLLLHVEPAPPEPSNPAEGALQ